MKKRTIILGVIVVLIALFLLDRCIWGKKASRQADPVTAQPPRRDSLDALNAQFQRVLDMPLPLITFTPPPPPPEPVAPPVAEVARPKPAATPKPASLRPAPAQPKKAPAPVRVRAPATTAASPGPASLPPRSEPGAVENGAYYVVRQKVERNGTYYLICSIMGDSTNRNFGYAVSADQYQRAERGLVFDARNMTGWRRVSRID